MREGNTSARDSKGDKNTKYFQIVATITKGKNFIWNIMDERGIWSDDQNVILQVFSNEFNRRFKKDSVIALHQAVPLSTDLSCLDEKWLTRDATEEKILQAVTKISPLKTSGPDGLHDFFIKSVGR